jgi:hypothetical protein
MEAAWKKNFWLDQNSIRWPPESVQYTTRQLTRSVFPYVMKKQNIFVVSKMKLRR